MLYDVSQSPLHMQAFTDLDRKTQAALQQSCGADLSATEVLYALAIRFYVESFEILGPLQSPFSERSRKADYRAIKALFGKVRQVVVSYEALTPFARELAEMTLRNPELDSEAMNSGLPPFHEDELEQALSRLKRIVERLSLEPSPRRGRPKLRDLREPAAEFCAQWEDVTGHAPTWNDKGTSGLVGFHRLASEAFDAVITTRVSAEDGSDPQVSEARFAQHRSAIRTALRDAVRTGAA
jgi:hypothetical protein